MEGSGDALSIFIYILCVSLRADWGKHKDDEEVNGKFLKQEKLENAKAEVKVKIQILKKVEVLVRMEVLKEIEV